MDAGLDVKERMKENMDAGIERRMDERKYGCWIGRKRKEKGKYGWWMEGKRRKERIYRYWI